MQQLLTILRLLSIEERKKAFLLLNLMFLGALLETLGIGLIIPVLNLITNESHSGNILNGYVSSIKATFSQNQIITFSLFTLLIVYFIKSVFLIYLTWKQNKFVFGVRAALSQRLFKKYLSMPWSYFLKTNSAYLINVLTNETNQFGAYALQPMLTLTTELIVVTAILCFLLLTEPIAAITIFGVLGTVLLIIYASTKGRISKWGKERIFHESARIQQVQQAIGGIKETKILGKENNFLKLYDVHNIRCSQVVLYQNTVQQSPRMMLEFIVFGIIFVVILLSINQGKSLNTILTTLALFAGAAFRLMPSATRIIGAIQSLRYANSVLGLLKKEVLDQHTVADIEAVNVEKLSFADQITISHVAYRYPDSELITIKDISLSIGKGSCIGLIGESGSGKSTLVDMLLGLLKPSHGHIYVDGIDINDHIQNWQRNIGYVPQTIFISDDSLRRNVAFGIPEEEINETKIKKALEMAQLSSLVEHLPEGLNTCVGEHGIRLSGGQRQRIGIARALYHDPDILVLDEATSALDNQTEAEVMNSVNALAGRKTLIIVAHRLPTLAQCDRLYWLDKGLIKDQGDYLSIVAKITSTNMQNH